jgi:hypothetical protein
MITAFQQTKAAVLHRITEERSGHERIFNYQKFAHVLISLEWLHVVPMVIG